MELIKKMKTFLKAVLPIADGVDLDAVLAASAILAKYYGKLAEKDDVTEEDFKIACSLIVSGFNGDSIQYLEECVKEFKEEVF